MRRNLLKGILIALVAFTVLIIARHRANIKRICTHQEHKISWM